MSQTGKKLTKGRALPPDPNRSLFKFKLSWLPDENNLQKRETWYSYDYPAEREMFPEGIDKTLRMQWKKLLQSIWKYDELYEYMKWIRPHNKEDTLLLFLPNWPEITSQTQHIEIKYGLNLIENYVHMVGFHDFGFRSVDSTRLRQAGNSPGRVDFRQFYGFKYLHRNDFIVTNLATGKLLKVDVYDNLMYHSENHLHTLLGRAPSQTDTSTIAVRGGTPKAIGTMIPNFKPE